MAEAIVGSVLVSLILLLSLLVAFDDDLPPEECEEELAINCKEIDQ